MLDEDVVAPKRCPPCNEIYGWVSMAVFASAAPAFAVMNNLCASVGWCFAFVYCLIWTLLLRSQRMRLGCCLLGLRESVEGRQTAFIVSNTLFSCLLALWTAYMFYFGLEHEETLNVESHYLASISALVGLKWLMYTVVRVQRLQRDSDNYSYLPIM